MPGSIIQYAFVAGELSPSIAGRADFEKYDLGLALARNWFIDYRGGLTTRPGTEFVDYIQDDHLPQKFFKFSFNQLIANNYLILFCSNYIRFIQDGAYILEGDTDVTSITNASPGVVTTTGSHGYSDGDWLKCTAMPGMSELVGRTVEVTNSTATTFEMTDPFGTLIDTTDYGAYTADGTFARIYTVTSPYSSGDLGSIKADQNRDTLRLTHPSYPVKNLVRTSDTDWTISDETFGETLSAPSNLGGSVSAAGTYGIVWTVTAVDREGNESVQASPHILPLVVNYASVEGWVTMNWDQVTNADHYRVYRSIIGDDDEITRGNQLGYIGRAYGTELTDSNIIPDFATTPPINNVPFRDQSISYIDVTNGGSGYDVDTATVSISDPDGSGFVGFPVVDSGGTISHVVILNGGEGYTAPTVSFAGGGASAAGTASTTGAGGNFPAISAIFQQRQLYAATSQAPLDIWASQVGQLSNFNSSFNPVDSDGWHFTVNSKSVAPIRYLLEMRGGLLVFGADTIWQIRSSISGAITATDAIAEPQSYLGIANIDPLSVDTNVLYVSAKDSTVRLLAYNDFSKLYAGKDVSILSSHFFKPDNPLLDWDYAPAPFKIVYGVREDGVLLTLTTVEEQDVSGWTWNTTDGLFKAVRTVEENGIDRTYFVVEREINGTTRRFIERLAVREFNTLEDAWCLDSALALPCTCPDADVKPAVATGDDVELTIEAGSFTFQVGDVGKIFFGGGGKAEIITYNSPTSVQIKILRDFTWINAETGVPLLIARNDWTFDAPSTTLSGLWHLEGKDVRVYGDGNVFDAETVTDGSITLPAGVVKAVVGLPYACWARTLPVTASDIVVEGRRKRVIGVSVRFKETRGLKTGHDPDSLYEMRDRTTEQYGQPVSLRNDMEYAVGSARWDDNGQTYLVQDYPLPASVLGLVSEVDIGDDTD